MKKAGPWSIDGIKPDIREAAREAARRQGLSLSAWLNDIISTQAYELGIDADEMDADDRLEAVAARLHQLDDREDQHTPLAHSRPGRAPHNEHRQTRTHDRYDSDPQAFLHDRVSNRMQDRTQGRMMPDRVIAERMRGQDSEALLDAAVDAFEHGIAKSQRQTAQSFEAVARRLADIESHLTQRPQEDSAKPIRSALARLEARLDTFTQTPAPVAPPRDDAGLKRLESKLDALLRGSALSTQRPVAKSTWRNSLESAVAEIGQKQNLLNGASERRMPSRRQEAAFDRPAASTHSADLQHLQRDIAALGAKLEEMRLQDLAKDLTRMRTDIGTMSAGMADLAPRDSVTAIESAIRNLTTRIETSREDGMRETLLKPITELVDDLRNSLGSMDPNPSLDGLGRDIKSIGERLEAISGLPHDPNVLSRVQGQIQDIHGLLTAAASHPLSFEEIERKVAALAEQMDRQRALGPMPSDDEFQSPRLHQAHVDSLAKIEDRLDDLSQKIERAMVGAANPRSSMDAESLEAIVRALADKFTAAQDPRAGNAAFESLQGQVAQLAHRLEQTDSGFSALTALQQSVGDLFTHLDETRFAAQEAAQNAARNAAHDAVREVMEHPELLPSNSADDPAITREIADLRAVQDEAGRRTHSTLNAVHETLEKIVDRLAMLEEEMGEAKEISAQDQRLSEQNAIFARYRDNEMAANQAAAAPLPRIAKDELHVRPGTNAAADFLIEPGSLFPNGHDTSAAGQAGDGMTPDPARSRSDFIAAARRAAQAAQTDHEMARARIPIAGPKETNPPGGLIAQARDFFTNHKRQLSLSIAALFLVVGAYAVVKTMQHSSADVSANDSASLARIAEARIDHKAGTRAPLNDVAVNMPPQQTHRDVTPAQISEAPPRVPDPPSAQSAPPTSLPLMAAGTGANATKAPEKPIAGSDPIVTSAITAPKSAIASLPETAAATLALREQAEGGNAAAQYELATRYAEGRVMPRDFKLAAEWYEKAATRGLGPAQYRLGSLYEKGIGVTRDLVRAKDWYQKAANQGHSHAMHNLAVLIAEGSDGKPDYAAASIWFRKAAELGIRDSQYNLAILYARGLGVQQDLGQSYLWFALAAAQGDEDAGKKREDVAAKLDAKALTEAKAAVDAFRPREADRAANEVQMPPGGWEAAAPAQSMSKTIKPKISRL